MAFPSFFIIFVISIFVFQHHLRKNNKIENKAKNEFWQKERKSLVVRKKEFSKEDYIVPDITNLTLSIPKDMVPGDELQLKQLVKKIKDLSTHDMMNFSDLSNTELRLRFGTANQSIITNNEYTYNNFLKALASYANLMNDYNLAEESMIALEQCISLGSDFSEHFSHLGQLYINKHMQTELNSLKETANNLISLNKKGILEKLESLTL
jgi:hypothetical protein